MRKSALLVLACLAAWSTTTRAASIVLGPPDLSVGGVLLSCDGPACYWTGALNTALSTPGAFLTAPADGMISSWRVRGATAGGGMIRLHVLRPVGGGMYLGALTSPAAGAVDGLTPNPIPGSLMIQTGDTLSVSFEAQNMVGWSAGVEAIGAPGGTYATIAILSNGAIASPQGPQVNQELLFNATLDIFPPEAGILTPTSGPSAGGTIVTIPGLHLTPATAVTFGGVPATDVSGSSNQLTATAPPHDPGVVDVQVVTFGGTTTALSPFTYEAPPDVTAPSLSGLAIAPAIFRAANFGGPISGTPVTAVRIGATVSYDLSEAATTTFTVERARGRGPDCVPGTQSRRKRRCTRYTPLPGSFTHAGVSGANQFSFSGRMNDKALRAGRYRLVGVAQDGAGNRSGQAASGFRMRGR
jgi:hypothetical protein